MYLEPERRLDEDSFPVFQLESSRLNITEKSRASRLPWRGQFSPLLVEYLLEKVCPDASVVLDPFCGSGTVLFEAAQRGSVGIGSEVNPAAWHLASLASLSGRPAAEYARLKSTLLNMRSTNASSDLFSSDQSPEHVIDAAKGLGSDPALQKCLTAAILLGMGDKPNLTHDLLARGISAVASLLDELKCYDGSAKCFLGDARSLAIDSETVDAVVTSPPYINVFNYHQNYRPAAELLGWHPLNAARSEIGANRKHRQNRFLTVVQYCMDMAQVLNELARVCRQGAPVVFVVGRESNVLGCSFRNSYLIESLMTESADYQVLQAEERVFSNRYGQDIYEDVIIARRVGCTPITLDFARSLGQRALTNALGSAPEKNAEALQEAITGFKKVQPSPLLAFDDTPY
ncbi:DNA methyltransferase [Pararobbsia alpina]|uniref:DNA methyltransferase n=1 Tax=Pararobbsia alpina TaxID=621374 RepID=UPI0039A4090F